MDGNENGTQLSERRERSSHVADIRDSVRMQDGQAGSRNQRTSLHLIDCDLSQSPQSQANTNYDSR